MRIHCPTCEHPLQIGGDFTEADPHVLATLSGVRCPNCGLVGLDGLITDGPADEAMLPEQTISFLPQQEGERTQIGHFRLDRLLGQGAFGSVWLADDLNLGRKVALKLPHARRKEVTGLLHEAQAAAHLRHPNIVSIYEVGTQEGQVYIACEYIDGLTLRDLLSAGKPALDRAVDLTIAIAGALEHAHRNRIVHRDVKPANIILNADGEPFVTDFGLAKRITTQSTESTISSEGQILGTARYMSPEQAGGKTRETDHRSDVYALGVILFEMLTGHVPFRGNMRAVLRQKIFDDAPSPRQLDPTLPRDLETICLKCLERDPDKRYQSAGALRDELLRFRTGEPILARPISSIERTWRWCRRRPMIAGLLGGLIASLTIGVAGVSFYWFQATRNARLLEASLYRTQMSLASEYLAHGDIPALQDTLRRAQEENVTADRRGFEWYYYNDIVRSFVRIFHHEDHIRDVALAADGKQLATAGHEGIVHIWDTSDGHRLRTLSPEKGRFTSVAFSPTTGQLATGSSDGYLRLWDPALSQEPLHQLKHGPPVAIVRFAPEGEEVLSAGETGAIRLWKPGQQSPTAEIPTGKAGTRVVEYSSDGRFLVVGTLDGRVRIRDRRSQQISQVLEPNPKLESLAISDDGQTIATGSFDGRLRIWSADGTLHYEHPTTHGQIGDLHFLHNQPVLVSMGTSGHMNLFDVERKQVRHVLKTHFLTSGVLDRSADGRFLAVGSGEGNAKLLDAAAIGRPNIFWHDAHLRGVAALNHQSAIAASADGAVRLWDLESGDAKTLLEKDETLTRMTVEPRKGWFAVGTTGAEVAVYSIADGSLQHASQLTGPPIAQLVFSPSGGELAIAQVDGSLSILSTRDDWPVVRVRVEKTPSAMCWNSDGSRLVVGSSDGSIDVYPPGELTSPAQLWKSETEPVALTFCPASGLLAAGTENGLIHLIDMHSHELRSTLKAHTSRINTLCVLPNGQTLASAGRDKAIKLWDSASGELLTTLYGHDRQVFCLAASPDGELLASGDLEGALRIWRAPRVR